MALKTRMRMEQLKGGDLTLSDNIADAMKIVSADGNEQYLKIKTTDTQQEIELGSANAGVHLSGATRLDGDISGDQLVKSADNLADAANAVDTKVVSAKKINELLDSKDLDFAGDTGGDENVLLDSQKLTIAGGTGLASVSSALTLTMNLSDTTVSAGSYGDSGNDDKVPSFTVNAQGQLTAAGHTTIDIVHTQVSDFDAGVQTNRLDQMAAPNADVNFNAQFLKNVKTPVQDGDGANKAYVDSVAEGLDVKDSVKAASTATDGNLANLSGTAITLDGVSLSADDRVLVKNQTTASENGIYIVKSGSWERSDDMDTGANAAGFFMFVEQGASLADCGFVCTANAGSAEVGTDALAFSQFSSAGVIQPGDGIDKVGNVISVDLKASGGLKIDNTELAIEPTDFAGTGLEDDGADNLRLAAQGNGIAGGAGTVLSVNLDAAGGLEFNGSAIRLEDAVAGAGLGHSTGVLSVEVDDASIEIDGTDGLRVMQAGIMHFNTANLRAHHVCGSNPSHTLASGDIDIVTGQHNPAGITNMDSLIETIDAANVQKLNKSASIEVYLNGQLLMGDLADSTGNATFSSGGIGDAADYKFIADGSPSAVKLQFRPSTLEEGDVIYVSGLAGAFV